MKNILITGGTGRIGKFIVKHLSQDNNIWLITRQNRSAENLKYITWDLTKPLTTKEHDNLSFDFVIHMAAITHINDSINNGKNNYLITKNLIDFLLLKNTNIHFIFFSTIDVYGIRNKSYPVDTNSDCNPSSYYGLAKLNSEILIKQIFNKINLLRIAPMIDAEGQVDLNKRIYVPGTKIKIRSPYQKLNSFSNLESIFESVYKCLNTEASLIENVTNGIIYTESDLLGENTFCLYIPKFVLNPLFYLLKKINTRWSYKFEHLLHKLFKNNTYA